MTVLGAVLAMTGGPVGLALFVGAVVLARRARRERARAVEVLRAARWNTDRAERHYREAKRIHANCRPSPFGVGAAVQLPPGTYPHFRRVPRGAS